MNLFPRWVLHVDLDSFFVEVERRRNPSLRGRPVIVGGPPENRGVVASAFYKARERGVRSAMPTSKAKRLCPDAIFVHGRHADYGRYSERLQGILSDFTPSVQMASIDEAYLDLTGLERLHGSPIRIADRLRERILADTGLPATCGLGSNRLIAKVASNLAKPAGRLAVPHGSEPMFLAPLPPRALPGIGPAGEERLTRYGLRRIADIAALGESTMERLFGREGRALWRRSVGWDDSSVRVRRDAPKSVGRDTTFGEDVADWERVAAGLRRAETAARTVTLKLRYADFHTITRAATLPAPTRDNRVIFETVRQRLLKTWTRRERLRLVGVRASDLSCGGWQLDLFESPHTEMLERLYAGIDRIRERHGFHSILRGESFSARR